MRGVGRDTPGPSHARPTDDVGGDAIEVVVTSLCKELIIRGNLP